MVDCEFYDPSFDRLDCGGQWVTREDWGCRREDDLPDDYHCDPSCPVYEEAEHDRGCDDRDDSED